MLIDEDRVAVRIDEDKAGRPLSFLLGRLREFEPLLAKLSLQLPDVLELGQGFLILVPARVEGQDVLVEHSLEQPDNADFRF